MIKGSAVSNGMIDQPNRRSLLGQPRVVTADDGLKYVCWVWVNPYLLFLILILLILSFNPPFQVVAYPLSV